MQKKSEPIEQAIAKALELRIPFVAFALPGSDTPEFYSDPFTCVADDNNAGDKNYVEISPWGDNNKIKIADGCTPTEFVEAELTPSADGFPPLPYATSYSQYCDSLSRLISGLTDDRQKCVISRVDSYTDPFTDMAVMAHVAMEAFSRYKDLMVYVFYTPQLGAWIAATPELLLQVDKSTGHFTTLALAGTMPQSDPSPWDEKNRYEQQIVADYIEAKLTGLGLSFDKSDLTEVVAGHNKHLATYFRGSAGTIAPDTIAQALHPTPAVAGYPLEEALKTIASTERHSRGAYAGTLSVVTPTSSATYVTLRCMQFSPQGYALYAGGGITTRSDPRSEWTETLRKMSTIANVLPVQNN